MKGKGVREGIYTFRQTMRKRQRHNRPPPHRLLHTSSHIRQPLIIPPSRAPPFADHSIDFSLCFPHHLRPPRNRMYKCNNNRRTRITPSFHHRPAQKTHLMLRETNFLILIQNLIHKRSFIDIFLPPGNHNLQVLGIECVHLSTYFSGTRFPESEESLGDVV